MGTVWSTSEIRVHTNAPTYSPGDEITGQISLFLTKSFPLMTIRLSLQGLEMFSILPSKKAHPHSRRTDILTYTAPIYNMKLQSGQYMFPFSFTLPRCLPSSFKADTAAYKANITYLLTVTAEQAKLSADSVVTVVAPIPAGPTCLTKEENFTLTNCCIFSSYLRVNCYLDKQEYWPGDRICTTLVVDTSRSSKGVRDLTIDLIRITRLRTKGGGMKTYTDLVKGYSVTRRIPAHKPYREDDSLEATFPLNELKLTSTSTHGSLIECGFGLTITVRTEAGMCSEGQELVLTVPVVIQGAMVPVNYAPPFPSEWKPEVMEQTRISMPPEFAPSAPVEDSEYPSLDV